MDAIKEVLTAKPPPKVTLGVAPELLKTTNYYAKSVRNASWWE